ncbi:hypothetical protein ACFOQM_00355 [Paenibacillus sp. GCM10012307]|uniref:Uncharacterized protein n=1 Tax=Paenibacillus roseus TaxID=2798579 RepID=A0A934J3J0_9BACL|nr:hypothetical protein [Paenibacillus roseus]MBJ6359780.1 hypothetical protein [Paenibacillus roseus]
MNQQQLAKMNTYNIATEQIDQISDSFQVMMRRKQRTLKVKEFLKRLSTDPSLDRNEAPTATNSISEWLNKTEYPIRQEMVFDYSKKRFVPSENKPRIDLADLMTRLLHKQGIECTFEDMMNFVLGGGTIEEFMNVHAPQKN